MQNNKQSTTPEVFFAHSRVKSGAAREGFKDELQKQLTALYVDNISRENSPSSMSIGKLLMNRAFLGLTAAVAIVIAVTAVVFSTNNVQPDTQSGNGNLGAEIVYSEGSVEYKTDQGWYQVEDSTELSEGAAVRTLGKSRAIINLDDGSAIRLNYETEIALTSLDPDNIDVTLASGSVYTRVAKLEREFEVVTAEARYLSLGTAYKTTRNENVQNVTVYESKVEVNKTDGEKLVIEQGKAYNLKASNPENDGLVYDLTPDKIKKDEFALWNREYDKNQIEKEEELGVLKDFTAPKLEITSHSHNQQTTAEKITLAGKTETSIKLTVNGKEVPVSDKGTYRKEYTLKLGDNFFRVVATDDSGNQTVKSLTIIRKQEVKPTEAPASNTATSGLVLYGTQVDNGIKLTWTVNNLNVDKGFKLLKSTSPNPTYPDNYLYYMGDGSARKTIVEKTDGKTYYFRICRYTGSGCDVYSNTVQVTAPSGPASGVESLSITHNGGGNVSWSVSGYSAKGYKVVWSKVVSAPTYPTASGVKYIYNSNPGDKSATVFDFDGSGTYYVRVCEYLGGACGKYSNTITVDL